MSNRITNDDLLDGFNEFKERHDERFNELENRVKAYEKAANRPPAASGDCEYGIKADDVADLRGILVERKSMSSLTSADGGYIVPRTIENYVENLITRQSPIRRVANAISIKVPDTRLPVNLRGATGGWVGEGDTRAETSTPQFAEVTLPGGTIYALPRVSEELVDDAFLNIEQFLIENVIDTIAEMESEAFIYGDGVKKPKGFLAGPTPVATADATRDFGTLQYVPTGAASALGANIVTQLGKMVFSLRSGYRQAEGCAWLMSTDVLSQIADLKDTTGRTLFTPSLREGIPGTLLGYDVVECEHMPSVGAGNFPIAFGNWRRAYTIADRSPLTVLADPYSQKGQVLWYFRRRTHGNLVNSNAIKLLKVAAT